MIRKLIKRYITCKHKNSELIREVLDHSTVGVDKEMKWYDRVKCKDCDKEYYCERYIKIKNKKYYI
jgi:hypothetical protein